MRGKSSAVSEGGANAEYVELTYMGACSFFCQTESGFLYHEGDSTSNEYNISVLKGSLVCVSIIDHAVSGLSDMISVSDPDLMAHVYVADGDGEIKYTGPIKN